MHYLKHFFAGVTVAALMLSPLPVLAHHLKAGEPAPALTLHTLDGRNISTSDLNGKVVIVTFWATWCPPCREELPLLSEYAAKHEKDGLVVLGFSLDEPADMKEVKKVASGLSFPVGLLGSQYAGEYGRVWRLPVSFVIDRNGKLVENGWDLDDPVWSPPRLVKVVDPLLR
jgi:cytochrome c biogenesis protein CcmG, thiol:disulfide interchange protein DsbE